MLKSISSFLLYVKDLQKSLEFYKSLGFIIHEESEKHFVARLNWFKIQCYDEAKVEFKRNFDGVEKGAGVFFYASVDNVDDYYKSLIEKDIKPSTEPRDWKEWRTREFVVKDPDGYRYIFYSAL